MATPTIVKRLFRTNAAQWVAAGCISAYYTLMRVTSRLDRPAMPIEGPCILAIWHGRLFLVPLLKHGPKPLIALISSHRDGQLISKAAATYGVETAMGSTTRGGMRAARELIRFARAGHSLLMTPDGPRGPRMQASEGILDLARLTGLPILPVSLSASRRRIFLSWDRFLLPGFFARLVVRWAEPIRVDETADRDELLKRLTTALTAVQNEADAAAGRPPVEPA
jgi:lysophospholipid acyltransferase (LPLAT)-like uncharacterized protein